MAYPIAPSNVVLTLVTGPIVNEAQQVFASWASQIIRLCGYYICFHFVLKLYLYQHQQHSRHFYSHSLLRFDCFSLPLQTAPPRLRLTFSTWWGLCL